MRHPHFAFLGFSGCGDTGHEERRFRGHGPFTGGEGERGGWRGHRGPGRLFASGDLRFLLLELIAQKPRHGYELIKGIEEELGGAYAPSPGIVYPMLTFFEESGWATVTTEGTRKLYSITEEGKAALEENRAAVNAIRERMAAFSGEGRPGMRDPRIMRAMQNVRMALGLRSGKLTEEQRSRIVDVLDRAAREIESV